MEAVSILSSSTTKRKNRKQEKIEKKDNIKVQNKPKSCDRDMQGNIFWRETIVRGEQYL